jgi:hypothetical protein
MMIDRADELVARIMSGPDAALRAPCLIALANAGDPPGCHRNIGGDVLLASGGARSRPAQKASERSTPMVFCGLAMRERSRVVKPGPHPRSNAICGRFPTVSETKASLVGSKTSETTRSRSAAKFVSPKE